MNEGTVSNTPPLIKGIKLWNRMIMGWFEEKLISQLNWANEMLVERINKINRDYSSLMVRHEKIQELSLPVIKI
jgi:hypothetical protein